MYTFQKHPIRNTPVKPLKHNGTIYTAPQDTCTSNIMAGHDRISATVLYAHLQSKSQFINHRQSMWLNRTADHSAVPH